MGEGVGEWERREVSGRGRIGEWEREGEWERGGGEWERGEVSGRRRRRGRRRGKEYTK